jgi:hypothetical protein
MARCTPSDASCASRALRCEAVPTCGLFVGRHFFRDVRRSFAHGPASAASHEDRTHPPRTHEAHATHEGREQTTQQGREEAVEGCGIRLRAPLCPPSPLLPVRACGFAFSLLRGSELSPRLVGSWLPCASQRLASLPLTTQSRSRTFGVPLLSLSSLCRHVAEGHSRV